MLAINGNEQSRGIVFSTELPRFPVLALPLVLLPLVGSVMYPDAIGIKECLAAFAVCGVGDFVIKRYYVDHALKRLTSGCWQRREVALLVYSESSARRARSLSLVVVGVALGNRDKLGNAERNEKTFLQLFLPNPQNPLFH
jgi:hypothetical protein